MLEVKDLTFAYSRKDGVVLDSLSLSLGKGKIGAILGPNGVGKSTLLKCIDGLLKPSSGGVFYDGNDLKNVRRKQKAQQIAIVFQDSELGTLNVYDSVRLGRLSYRFSPQSSLDEEETLKAIQMVGLEEKMDKNVMELSGGERQKVAIARALSEKASLLLLDEPTASLDIKNQEIIMRLIKKLNESEGLSVLLSLHDINLALRFADVFYLFKDGKIAYSGDDSIVNRSTIDEIYGIKAREHVLEGHKYFTLGENDEEK